MLKNNSGTNTRKPHAALNPIPRQMLKKVSIEYASGDSLSQGVETFNHELAVVSPAKTAGAKPLELFEFEPFFPKGYDAPRCPT